VLSLKAELTKAQDVAQATIHKDLERQQVCKGLGGAKLMGCGKQLLSTKLSASCNAVRVMLVTCSISHCYT
jgi:hypothetical protein